MADRKVYVEVKVRLVLRMDESKEVKQVLDEMGYEFTPLDATLEDSEILDYTITDSK
jgi:hypothetical protein